MAVRPSTQNEAPQSPSSGGSADWAACKGKDPDAAITACTRLVGSGLTGTDLGLAQFYKGYAHSNKRQYAQAVSAYDEAIRLGAEVAAAYNNRGDTYLTLDKFDAALRDFESAIRTEPSYALAYANRGETYRRQDQPDRAVADASEALRLDPKLIRGYWVRALAYLDKQRWSEAADDCSSLLRLDPRSDSRRDRRGYAYWNMVPDDRATADL